MTRMLLFIFYAFYFWGCNTNDHGSSKPILPSHPIVVLYENDVHCAVDGYAKLVALRNKEQAKTPYVTTVSCGDFVQGDVIGSVSRGENIIEIMNCVGYDVVVLGNHEFDFGIDRMFELTEELDAEIVCANFRDIRTEKLLFSPYKIISYGDVDIAYLGLTTTSTATSVAPKIFRDEEGNLLYDFSKHTFYESIQYYIDQSRIEGADYVVVLSHLGDVTMESHPTSIGLITNTTGIDVVLDGHAHRVIPDTLISNQEGKQVLLTSTGSKFEWVGVLTLSTDGSFTSSLIATGNDNTQIDNRVQAYVDEIKERTLTAGERVVGENEIRLSINDISGQRLVRKQETNIGNFCADAFRMVLNTDIAMINGGGIRADIPIGEITYNHLLSVFPFNNTVCIATLTGQQLLDALELSVMALPIEQGEFMQVSGMKFKVDTTVPSSVVLDQNDLFSHVGEGARRVTHLMILNQESGLYEPVDLNRRYSLASFDYQIKNLGSCGIFRYAELKEDDLGQDVDILLSYIELFLKGTIGHEYANTEGRIDIL